MSFDSFGDFLAMGGHGLYVWLAYGSALVVIGANVASVRRARRRFFAEARAVERRRRAHPGAAAECAASDAPSSYGSAAQSNERTGVQTGKPVGS